MQQVREKFQQVRDLFRRFPDLLHRGARPAFLRRALTFINDCQGFADDEKIHFLAALVLAKTKTKGRSINLSKKNGRKARLLVEIHPILAAKAAFRPHSRSFSCVKIFQQNPFLTKYFSKKRLTANEPQRD
jgi:hypothetical protein